MAALPCIQHTLDANGLTWSDVGLHPDRPFASFIHASPQQEPTWDLIIDTRRKCRKRLRLNSPDDFFPEAWTKRCNEYSIFKPGLLTTKRREGDQHTLRGLPGVYQFRVNTIVVSSNHHHTKTIPLPSRNNHPVTVSLISPCDSVHRLYLSGDAADCGKRVLFAISVETYFGIYQNAMCSCSLLLSGT